MGRPRIPDEVKALRGTDQPCRMSKSALPAVDDVTLIAPAWMTLPQKRMFRACAKVLKGWRVLQEADAAIITMYVTTLDRYVEAERHLNSADEGLVVDVPNRKGGGTHKELSPWYQVSKEERKLMLMIEQRLGFSPASRAKIVSMIKPAEEAKDDFSEYDG